MQSRQHIHAEHGLSPIDIGVCLSFLPPSIHSNKADIATDDRDHCLRHRHFHGSQELKRLKVLSSFEMVEHLYICVCQIQEASHPGHNVRRFCIRTGMGAT